MIKNRAHVSYAVQDQNASSTPQTPKVPVLPSEVLQVVFGHLLDIDRKALTACCRVSHHFWSIASPILYRHINLAPNPKRDSRHDGVQLGPSQNLENVVITDRKKALLAHARVMTIDAHWEDLCNQYSVKCTKVEILRVCCLIRNQDSLGPLFHVDNRPIKDCPIVKTLKLKRLVFDTTFLECMNPYPRGFPRDVYQHVEELVFICPVLDFVMKDDGAEDFPPMPNLKKVVLIFYTPNLAHHWQQGPILTELSLYRVVEMFWQLSEVPMFVVNAGSLYAHMVKVRPWSEEKVQAAVQEEFHSILKVLPYNHVFHVLETTMDDPRSLDELDDDELNYRMIGTPETQKREKEDRVKLERKKQDIHFISMKEYVMNHDWEGGLDPAEVHAWLKSEDPSSIKRRSKDGKASDGSETSTQSNADCLPLPREILSKVFSLLLHFDRTTLTACCLTSRAFFDVAAPVLYRHVYVSSIERFDSRLDRAPNRYTDTGKEKQTTRKKKLLRQAEMVTIEFHHPNWCKDKAFKYPDLKTLVLDMAQCHLGLVLHPIDAPEKLCPCVKGLQPKKLILQWAHLCNISADILGVPEKLFDNIEELTFVCPITEIMPTMCFGGFGPMKKLKRLTWIFSTPNPATRWTLGTQGIFGNMPTQPFMGLSCLSGTIVSLPDVPILIVNAGSIDHKWLGLKKWNEKRVEEKVIEIARSSSCFGAHRDDEEENYEEKFDRAQFISMREYIEKYDWTGELEPEQVKAFLA
ncbi:hypothetical protein IAT40_004616 [Kwoniella sp. CBS 6097]